MKTMITENLYENILINPATNGSNELFIVSGYSSATFLSRHIEDLKDIDSSLKINLPLLFCINKDILSGKFPVPYILI